MSEDMLTVLIVFGFVLVIVGMAFRHAEREERRKEGRESDPAFADLARRLEHRVETLERILDREAPDWRRRSND